MGSDTPKQFLELGGIPILQRSIERFAEAEPDIRVITVLPRSSRALWEELCRKHCLNRPQMIADGGITRFHSVQNALAFVPDGALVAIHDGVRPLVSAGLIRKMFSLMESRRALIPVIPVTDSLKQLELSGERAAEGSAEGLLPLKTAEGPDPDRARLFGAQTPQMFRSEEIKDAYARLGFRMDFTDDASLAKAAGIPISYVAGEKSNIKITTPEDLPLAEYLLTL